MTVKETIKKLKAKIKCMQRETSGIDSQCNNHNCDECALCYGQGTTGEQKKALVMAVKSLEAWEKVKKETTNWHNIKLTIEQYEFLDIIEPYLSEVEE